MQTQIENLAGAFILEEREERLVKVSAELIAIRGRLKGGALYQPQPNLPEIRRKAAANDVECFSKECGPMNTKCDTFILDLFRENV